MATVNFEIRSRSENANIYVRVSIDRNRVFRRKSGYAINPQFWSVKKNEPKTTDPDSRILKNKLDDFKLKLTKVLNLALEQNVIIDSAWLKDQIDLITGKREIISLDILTNYFDYYIANLPNKVRSNGTVGVKPTTITKYKTLKSKIENFQVYSRKNYLVRDVGLDFRTKFIHYLKHKEQLHSNTIGRLIPFVKSICRDAKINGIETHYQLDQIKGYTVPSHKVFFDLKELDAIRKLNLDSAALNNARNWLIIGCYCGQRVSDLLRLSSSNIITKKGRRFIELTQIKTQKAIVIPIHSIVQEILEQRAGEFPSKISAQKFNLHIKTVAELAGINEVIEGGKIDTKKNRKVIGYYPKYELITSHICRRSFATNHYGEIPTALLMRITGHSSEKTLRIYLGKEEIDYAEQLADYWLKKE